MHLHGHTVLITGGTAGIGRALALAFRDAGNQVLVAGRTPDGLAAAKAAGLQPYACDLSRAQAIDDLAARVTREHPALDVVINNAGVQFTYEWASELHPVSRIEHEIRLNLVAPLRLTAQLLPVLLDQPEAAIVNVTSGLAVVPKPSAPVYCATKAALRSFTTSLRAQLATTSVRVFELIPPLVDTAMTSGRSGDKVSPGVVAEALLRAIAHDQTEVRVGKVRLLWALHRLMPVLAARVIRRQP